MKWNKPEPAHIRGTCVVCNTNKQKAKGGGRYGPLCSPCEKRHYSPGKQTKYVDSCKRPYRKYVGTECETCGFTSEFKCQFDVDHIDGDHSNNDPTNLQTLCANCHRLKTFLNKDWLK